MKKIFVLLLSGILCTSSVPMNSYASIGGVATDAVPVFIKAEEPRWSTVEPTNQGLESAIKTVKDKIVIPKEYSEFNYYFTNTNSYADSYWSLNWRDPSTSSYIQVNCDSDNHITFYAWYDYTNKNTRISTYLKKELKVTADEFIKKIAPETSNKLEYMDATYEGIYSGNYVYNYQRKNNGIDFPDNSVSVSVNSVSGKVTSASINWIYGVSVPSAKVTITKEEATKLLKENMKMKLVYRTDFYGIYDKSSGSTSKKAFLVYEPSEGYISVDAKSGKVYFTKSEWVDTGIRNEEEKSDATASDTAYGSTNVTLTEEEIAKIEELKGLISKSEAIKKVTSNPYLHIDKNLKSFAATLNKSDDGSGDTSYVWNINLNDPREIDDKKDTNNYRAYAYAMVDAKTGKILSFNASVKNYYDEVNHKWKSVKIPYDKEEGKVILEKFLGTQMKDRFSNSIIVEQKEDYVAYYKNEVAVYGGYSYQYNRVNAGVEYPYNGIYGSIDGVTGKIYSYGSNWDYNVTFESPVGAMSPKEAMDQYLSKDGYELKYEINVMNQYDSTTKSKETYYDDSSAIKVAYEIRLVYRPDIHPSSISPFTGEQLNYNGEVYKVTKPFAYIDIQDTKENRDILLLSDMNIGFDGEYFYPNHNITIGEMNDLLQKIGYGYGYMTEETNKIDQLISREELAQTFIVKLGMEKVSKLKDIYKTGYADESSIASKYLGAVALAKGLGLMEADANNNFNAKNKVTRSEAVRLILQFIKVQPGEIYY